MEFFIAQGPILGFNIVEVFLHLLTLTVLVIAIRFLLYKPIKKFMDKRAEQYNKIEEEYNQMKKNSDELKSSGDGILEQAKKEAFIIEHDAKLLAQEQSENILEKAKCEASEILKKAIDDADKQKAQVKEQIAESISDVAINLASKILEREFKKEDNDKIITAVLDDWKSK